MLQPAQRLVSSAGSQEPRDRIAIPDQCAVVASAQAIPNAALKVGGRRWVALFWVVAEVLHVLALLPHNLLDAGLLSAAAAAFGCGAGGAEGAGKVVDSRGRDDPIVL